MQPVQATENHRTVSATRSLQVIRRELLRRDDGREHTVAGDGDAVVGDDE